jgi:hypothetical protein
MDLVLIFAILVFFSQQQVDFYIKLHFWELVLYHEKEFVENIYEATSPPVNYV